MEQLIALFLVLCLITNLLMLAEINGNLRRLQKALRLRRPKAVYLKLVSQGENGMLKFVLVLPEKGAADVVKRHLTVSVGAGEPAVLELDGDATRTDLMEGVEGDAVAGSLVDEDDAGNKSEAREFSFTLVDTIAPPQPGEVGVEVVSEE